MKIVVVFAFLILMGCSQNASDARRSASSLDRAALADRIEHSLQTETMAKWYPQSVDKEYGGYISSWTFDFKPQGDQDKMIVSQARHLWVHSKAIQSSPDVEHYKSGAEAGFQFLKEKMWDHEFGGFYTLVSRDGKKVLDDSKTGYGNAFAIYGLAGYYAASKDSAALNLVKKAFHWLEDHAHDRQYKGYFQHLKRDGTRILRDATTDSRAETGYKDQNSSIHLLEAFAELYAVWPDPLLKERLMEMLVLIRDTISTPKGYMVLFFQPDWTPVSFRDSTREVMESHHRLDHVSFGHDIETAYLMLEASHILGIHNDSLTHRKAKRMVDHCLSFGYDSATGGIYDEAFYFKGSATPEVTHDTKNWWAQAEAMNTLLIMADLYPDDPRNYEEKFLKQWEYIDKYIIDHQHGDWFSGGIDKQPELKMALKGHQWKTTYHHYRSMANCIERLRGNGPKF